jgi:hypothetical protein
VDHARCSTVCSETNAVYGVFRNGLSILVALEVLVVLE